MTNLLVEQLELATASEYSVLEHLHRASQVLLQLVWLAPEAPAASCLRWRP